MDLLKPEMLGDVIINIINILILFFVTKKLLYQPVKKYLTARREKELAALTDAEQSRAEAEEAKARYDALVKDAETENEKLLADAKREAKENADEILSGAKRSAATLLEDAQRTADAEKAKLMQDAHREIGQTAVALSGKILGREVSDADNRRLIDDFFKHLGD